MEVRQIRHIAVGIERSEIPCPAIDLAAEMANQYGAELHLIQVLLPGRPPGTEISPACAAAADRVAADLRARLASP